LHHAAAWLQKIHDLTHLKVLLQAELADRSAKNLTKLCSSWLITKEASVSLQPPDSKGRGAFQILTWNAQTQVNFKALQGHIV